LSGLVVIELDTPHREQQGEPTASGLPTPFPRGAQGMAYVMASVRGETRLVATARQGTRNDTLNRAAFGLGQLSPDCSHLWPSSPLASAAERPGLPEDEARRTIRSG
jgi:hypothetical protein